MTPKEVLALCREKDVQTVDLRIVDLSGQWHAISLPASGLTEETFEDGIGIDGSRFQGWQPQEESDLLIVPQPETAFIDPLAERNTLNLICSIQDPFSREDYSKDPRNVTRRSIAFLNSTSIADAAQLGIEAPLILQVAPPVESENPVDTRYRNESLLRDFAGHFIQSMERCSISVKTIRQFSQTPAVCEVALSPVNLVLMADQVMMCKHVANSVAAQHGARLSLLPNSSSDQTTTGLHTLLSLWKDRQPIFAGADYAGTSEAARFAIGGILHHVPALAALGNPSPESFQRLENGAATRFKSGYSQGNRSLTCRIPGWDSSPNSRQVEFRLPDATANPYLLFAAILMAAIDGIQNKIDPGKPFESWSFNESAEHEPMRQPPAIPKTLGEALQALQSDQQFLLRGDVFTSELIDQYIRLKGGSGSA